METPTGLPAATEPSRGRGLRDWLRTVGYVVAGLWWFIVVLNLAANVGEPDRGGAYAFGAVLGAAGTTLLFAAGIRWVYTKIVPGRRVLSPWLFVIAALFALLSYAGNRAEEERSNPPPASVRF